MVIHFFCNPTGRFIIKACYPLCLLALHMVGLKHLIKFCMVLKCKHQISAADYNPAMKFEQILKCQRNFNRSALYWLLTILVDDIAARSAINNNLRLTITEKIRQSIQRVFLHRCNQSNTVYIRLTYTGLLLQHSPFQIK